MFKTTKKITNPMTVIAIFAVISEGSAAASLPFLDNKEREIYIWFLISFPFYLLLLFFLTLNFNYRSLYAPSDFETDEAFLKAFDTMENGDRLNPDSVDEEGLFQTFKLSNTPHSKKTTRSCPDSKTPASAQDPPFFSGDIKTFLARHHIKIPGSITCINTIDTRRLQSRTKLETLLKKIPQSEGHCPVVVIILVDFTSESFLDRTSFKPIKVRKDLNTPTCIFYDVCEKTVTMMVRA